MRVTWKWGAATVVGLVASGACASFAGTGTTLTWVPGCYTVEVSSLIRTAADSLASPLPAELRLTSRQVAGPVPGSVGFPFHELIPNTPDYPRYWTQWDALPSGSADRQRRGGELHGVRGDSVDIYFPGPVGSLVLRVAAGPDGSLSGRGEWINLSKYPASVLDAGVRLGRLSCAADSN